MRLYFAGRRAPAPAEGHWLSWPAAGQPLLRAFVCLSLAAFGNLAGAAEKPNTGSSTRQVREEAARAIPLEKLADDIRPKVASVLKSTSVFRRVPVQVIDCDPDLYLFLARHPEVVVDIWQVMGISKVALVPNGPQTYQGTDGAGTTGDLRMCYSNHDTQVVYAEGSYEGPMFGRPIRAQCVLVLRAGYVQETNGRYYITNRLDTFIHFDNMGLDLIAKTFNPLVSKTVDVNFRETIAFVSTISRTAEVNAPGMKRLAAKLTMLDPAVCDDFVRLSTEVAAKAAERGPAADKNPTAASSTTGEPNSLTSVKGAGKKLRR
jgi:hypothetical protein